MLQVTDYRLPITARRASGLVGGHCIPVDPYYLVYKAKELGYHPQVILAGRAINDYMPKHVAEMAIKGLNETFLQAKTFTKKIILLVKLFFLKKRFVIKGSKVLIMGLTYKENVADTRESPVREMVKELKEFGVEIYGYDPMLSKEEIETFGMKALDNLKDFLLAQVFFCKKKKCVDVRGMFSEEEAKKKGFYYRRV